MILTKPAFEQGKHTGKKISANLVSPQAYRYEINAKYFPGSKQNLV